MKQKVLVFGGLGLVRSKFIELNKHFDIKNSEVDVTDLSSVQETINEFNPDWIINFPSIADIDAAEKQRGDTSGSVWNINVNGVQNIVDSFKSKNIIQISTEMVFPGTVANPGPYSEEDRTPDTEANLTWYGWTKNRAEKIIIARGGVILRINYPVVADYSGESDFIRTTLQKYVDGKLSPLFNDQQFSISFVLEIAITLQKIIETESHGIFHASSDTTTPFELMTFVLKELGEDETILKQSSIHDFLQTIDNKNRYPVWGGLKTIITEELLDTHFSTWQTVVEFLIGQGLKLPQKS